ncbi:TOMM precursor leader peptide-binding protein, partial [Streptomyces palmae]
MQTTGHAHPFDICPRLRNDVVFLRVDTGIYLRSAETSCVLKGAGAYEWMSVLAPRMTGEWSIAELCEGLDENRRKTAFGLIRTLLDRGFARDMPQSGPDLLPESVLTAFAPQINFVEHFTHADPRTPQELFARFRTARVLVSGAPGGVAAAAVRGLLRNGLAEVVVDDPAWGAEFDAEIAALAGKGVSATVATVPGTPEDLSGYDAVVCAADGAHTAALLDLTRRAHGAEPGPRLLPVVVDSRQVVLGPVSGPAGQPCWVCARLRLAANSDPAAAADFWRELALGPVGARPADAQGSAIARDMVGNAVAFEVFRLLTGQLREDDERHAVIQDLATLESRRERVLPHPGCPLDHGSVAVSDVMDTPSAPVDDADAYGKAAVLVSPGTGIMSGWTDDPIKQIPLKTGRVRLAPAGELAAGAREISAFDTDTILVARTRAVRSAVRAYVAALGPGRHRHPADPSA